MGFDLAVDPVLIVLPLSEHHIFGPLRQLAFTPQNTCRSIGPNAAREPDSRQQQNDRQ